MVRCDTIGDYQLSNRAGAQQLLCISFEFNPSPDHNLAPSCFKSSAPLLHSKYFLGAREVAEWKGYLFCG